MIREIDLYTLGDKIKETAYKNVLNTFPYNNIFKIVKETKQAIIIKANILEHRDRLIKFGIEYEKQLNKLNFYDKQQTSEKG